MSVQVPVKDMDNYSLNDKYSLAEGRHFLSGSQALARLLLDQARRDRAAGLNTGGFVSGYRGSPLGGVDMALWDASAFLEEENIKFEPGLNEDLAVTAVWGSQQTDILGPAKVDGVFGLWYGKNPGLDRSGDAIKHANFAGTSRYGGVLAVSGDDPGAASSSIANGCEQAFQSAMMPVLYPADIGDMIDLGLKGYGLSRYSGLWVGFKLVADVVEATRSVKLDRSVGIISLPKVGIDPKNIVQRWPDDRWSQDQRLQEIKLPAALEFGRANAIDRIVMDAPGRRLGLVAAGKAYQDVRQALDILGVTDQVAMEIGLSVYKLGMIWPIEPEQMGAFARGLKEILVVEERRGFIETQIKELAYNWPASSRPLIVGKTDEQGRPLIPSVGVIEPMALAVLLGGRLLKAAEHPVISKNLKRLEQFTNMGQSPNTAVPVRIPHFCPGCPHNRGTKLPEGSAAMAGIGCHSLAMWFPGSDTITLSQMGGEGANWIGAAPFVERGHMFQNLGDGTYAHSGILAIRAAKAANSHVTFKILQTGVVAMTGGQPVEGAPTVRDIALQIHAEGIDKLALVSDAPERYGPHNLPPGTAVHERCDLDAVMTDFSTYPGTSVIIYEQMCATEMRRQRKRGRRAPAKARVVINEAVCEACGDCSVQSSCIAVRAVDTPFGIKRQVDQSSCNSDLSCLEGFCPAMVTVTGARLRVPEINTGDGWTLNEPALVKPEVPYSILIAGVGGTGLITVGAILAMAAHLEGLECSALDNTGIARMGGGVTTHLRLAPAGATIHAPRIHEAGANLLLACDPLVAAGSEVAASIVKGQTRAVVNSHMAPSAAEAFDPETPVERDAVFASLRTAVTDKEQDFADASWLALTLLGNKIYANMLLTGFAFQKGLIPLPGVAIERAIRLNGTEVINNMKAFTWGRRLAEDRKRVLEVAGFADGCSKIELGEQVRLRMDYLTQYRNQTYAVRYGELVEKYRARETELIGAPGAVTEAVVRNYFKLMAVKDEFEVARLFTDGVFDAELREMFEDGYQVHYHVGRLGGGKRRLGPWLRPVMAVLARFKRYRNNPFNPLFYTADRRRDRKILTQYEELLEELLERLTADKLDLAEEIANIPDGIRGFGHIRDKSIAAADMSHERLIEAFNEP